MMQAISYLLAIVFGIAIGWAAKSFGTSKKEDATGSQRRGDYRGPVDGTH